MTRQSSLPKPSAWQRIRAVLGMRAPLVFTIISLAIAGVTFLIPFPLYWELVFEPLQLYRFWPVLILAIGAYLTRAAFHRYRQNGLPQYLWIMASVTLFLMAAVVFWLLLADTAVDWSLEWSIIAVIVLTIAVWVALPSWIGYTEIWRWLFNSSVIEHVREALRKWTS